MGRCIAESELEEFHQGENVIPVAELIGIATMTSEWTVLIEVVRQWRWRCLADGTVVPGLELCVTNLGSGQLVTLAESNFDAVQRHDLRHNCGGRVTPIAPLNAM